MALIQLGGRDIDLFSIKDRDSLKASTAEPAWQISGFYGMLAQIVERWRYGPRNPSPRSLVQVQHVPIYWVGNDFNAL